MSRYLCEAYNGENGSTGNRAGDQGNELRITPYYDYSWNVALRYPDAKLAAKVANIIKRIICSKLCGYDQGDRNSLYRLCSKYNWDLDAVLNSGELVECDCSSLTYVGWCFVLPSLRSDDNAPTTHAWDTGVKATFLRNGFQEISVNNANKDGDIVLREGYHVATVSTSNCYTVDDPVPTYKLLHKYTLQVAMPLHTQAALSSKRVKYSDLNRTWKKLADEKCVVKKGVKFTCRKVLTAKSGNIYIKCSQGWFCAYKNGKVQIK